MRQFVQNKVWGARAENRTEQSYRCGRRPCSSCERLANDAEHRKSLITSLQSRFPPLHSWFRFPFTILTFELLVLLIETGTCSKLPIWWFNSAATSSLGRAGHIATLEKIETQHPFFEFASRARAASNLWSGSGSSLPQSHLGSRGSVDAWRHPGKNQELESQESNPPWNPISTTGGPKQVDVDLRLG